MEGCFSLEMEVTEDDISARYNHVHHARALHYLEAARARFLEHLGCPLDHFVDSGILIVLSSISVMYKRELTKGPIRVTCENPRIEGKSVFLEQRIFNKRNKEAVSSKLELVFMSAERRRAIAPPDNFKACWESSRATVRADLTSRKP